MVGACAEVQSSDLSTASNLLDADWAYPEHLMWLYQTETVKSVLEKMALLCFGNFIIKDNMLYLVRLFDMPEETFYLINENRDYITFGDTRIIVR